MLILNTASGGIYPFHVALELLDCIVSNRKAEQKFLGSADVLEKETSLQGAHFIFKINATIGSTGRVDHIK